MSTIQSAILANDVIPKKPILTQQDIELKKTKNLLVPPKKPSLTELGTDKIENNEKIVAESIENLKASME